MSILDIHKYYISIYLFNSISIDVDVFNYQRHELFYWVFNDIFGLGYYLNPDI